MGRLAGFRIAGVIMAAAIAAGCGFFGEPGGAMMIRKVSDRLSAGDPKGAEAITDRYFPRGPNPSPYNLKAWCGASAVKSRLEAAGYNAAKGLITAYKNSDDPVVRYALVRDQFDSSLKSVDQGLETLCAQSPVRISTLNYDAARRPLADQMQQVLLPMERTAKAGLGSRDFEEAIKQAVNDERKRSRQEFEKSCKEMAERAGRPSYEKDALTQQAEDSIRSACSLARAYGGY